MKTRLISIDSQPKKTCFVAFDVVVVVVITVVVVVVVSALFFDNVFVIAVLGLFVVNLGFVVVVVVVVNVGPRNLTLKFGQDSNS